MEKQRIFVDMDGTLARFHDEVDYLERMFEKDFFRFLNPFPTAVTAINEIASRPDYEVYILSATIDGEPPHCRLEKNDWIDRYLPNIDSEHRLFTNIGADKSSVIPDGIRNSDILWDDYNKNLDEWKEAGGVAVKCRNNINHKGLVGPLWNGIVIRNDSPQYIITQSLLNAAYTENSHGVKIKGHIGTWHTIETTEINGSKYFLLEHEEYGDSAANIIVNNDGSFMLDDVRSGFDELREMGNEEQLEM